ncbi:MAG: septum formation protein Maf [Bacillota bacterium]|nr:MAG: septum formation protein Maf [Bacillota bacterium]
MCINDKTIILASASPRRAAFLRELGVAFTVMPADIDEESVRCAAAEETVKKIALEKARRVFERTNGAVLAADSAVVLGGEIFGKPKNAEDAKRMLRLLSGRAHEVMTGVAFLSAGKTVNECVTTKVFFNALGEEFISSYVAGGSPLDKAGAYGIQDGGLVEKIEGSYTNVVGLPMELVRELFKKEGFLTEE